MAGTIHGKFFFQDFQFEHDCPPLLCFRKFG